MSTGLPNVKRVEAAFLVNRGELFRFGTALLFIVVIMLYGITHSPGGTHGVLLVAAAMIGGYMALNIGANDVANNVGPAVGSQAITLTGADGNFCSGADLRAMAGDAGPDADTEIDVPARMQADPALMWKCLLRDYQPKKPLIAACNGVAPRC